jgi:CRP-like cAMP-binding protein
LARIENHLIELLPRVDRRNLLAACKLVTLVFEDTLAAPGKPTGHVYFPIHGFISLIARVGTKPALEVGMVGREGMLGVQLALGVSTVPLQALVQGGGDAWRITAAAFRVELKRSPALQRILDRYLYVLMTQFASSAACIRFHRIDQRLARWLLMTRDRADSDRFRVTHAFLAYMLGVRRVGVTAAAGALQRRGLITYHRGDLTVLEPAKLLSMACSCYATDRHSYEHMMEAP